MCLGLRVTPVVLHVRKSLHSVPVNDCKLVGSRLFEPICGELRNLQMRKTLVRPIWTVFGPCRAQSGAVRLFQKILIDQVNKLVPSNEFQAILF